MKMINKFVETCTKNSKKTAFIVKNKRISFGELLTDVYKMINLFKKRNVTRGSKALLYVLPSYEFYVLLFACIYHGINIVVPDSYKNRRRIKEMMKRNGVNYVFCNRFTGIFKFGLPENSVFLDVSVFHKYSSASSSPNTDEKMPVLTTFTSGTTGEPKPINRSVSFLKEQIETVLKNIEIGDSSVVFGTLPIYVLFIVYNGCTCVLGRSLSKRRLQKYRVDTLLTSISILLKARGDFEGIKKIYCGGARLYGRDVEKLKASFPSTKIFYIYGASECALIGITDLDYYFQYSFAIKSPADGVAISLVEKDENGVGKILVSGDGVLAENNRYLSNDLGYSDDLGLHIVGRSKYSLAGGYNYLLDEEILSLNEKVKRGFSLAYEGKIYFCYEGKISIEKEGVIFVRFHKLPMDAKHKTKLDYAKTVAALKKKGF